MAILAEDYSVKVFRLRTDISLENQTIPLFDIDAVAGFSTLFAEDEPPIDEVIIAGIPKCDGAVYVIGDSMTPELKAGDIVMYKTVNSRRGGLAFGEMYLLVYDEDGDEHIAIKYVEHSNMHGYYKLVSNNPKYSPLDIPVDSVRQMGLIKACVRRYNT